MSGQRGQERDGFQARFGEQAVADPYGVESAGIFAALRHIEEFGHGHGADDDAAVSQGQSE